MGNGPTKEEKLIKEIATKETLLECPVLVDLKHGTIRHRHEERLTPGDSTENANMKIGYFYHPRLNDFSEDAIMSQSESNRLKYVFKGPSKDTGKKLYYIYGTSVGDKDKGINHAIYKPQGKGYDWPQSYRKANNLYFDVIFPTEVTEEDRMKYLLIDDDISEDSSVLVENDIDMNRNVSKENILLKAGSNESVGSIIERVSLQLLIPSSNIHLMVDKQEIISNELLGDFRPEDSRNITRFTAMLRLT